VGEDQGVHFIAFEFVRGTNVREFILQKGRLSPQDAVNYALQIAQALRHMHLSGVVHRDIKPSNIIVTASGRAKLVDLGLARQLDATLSHELTVAGTTLGTFDYIAPEQARDPRSVDVRADIYALGCTLYHMLTGEPPFPRGTVIEKVVEHHRDDPPDPAERNSQISTQLSAVIRRMMASNPDDRYATPDHLLHDLSIVAHAYGLRPTHPDEQVWEAPLQRSLPTRLWEQNRGWIATVVLLLLIAAIVGRRDELPGAREPRGPDQLQTQNTSENAPRAPENEIAPSRPAAPVDRLAAGISKLSLDSLQGQVGSLSTQDEPAITRPSGEPPEPPPADSGTEDIAPTTPPKANDVFAVIAADGAVKTFPTLDAAVLEAGTEATIELKFDGPSPPQPPVRVNNKRLIIRAARDRHPTLVFEAKPNYGNQRTQMISVTNGTLKLSNVGLTMQVTASSFAERWALFSLTQAEELELRGVSISVENPQSASATILEIVSPRSVESLQMMRESGRRREVIVDWADCFARGTCDVIVNETLEPAEIRLNDVALAAQGTLLRSYGQEQFDGPPPADSQCSIELRRVSAILGEGILRVDSGYGEFPIVDFNIQDTLVAVRPQSPFILMVAKQDQQTISRRLLWQSVSSSFEVAGPAWEIEVVNTAAFELEPDQLGLNAPQSFVERVFERPFPWESANFAEVDRLDFEPASTPQTPVATDGSVAGVRWSERIRVPSAGDEAISESPGEM
jgi:serine/threonine-protein kinase